MLRELLMRLCGIPPCTACGLCCTTGLVRTQYEDPRGYVQLRPGDRERLLPRDAPLLDEKRNALRVLGDVGSRASPPGGSAERCAALTGTPGRSVGCSIYERRPQNCRTFERGAAGCLFMLERASTAPADRRGHSWGRPRGWIWRLRAWMLGV